MNIRSEKMVSDKMVGVYNKNLDMSKRSCKSDDLPVSQMSASATDLLRASLIKFFSQKENMDKLLPVIQRTSPVSLRLLDYFCVNYAKTAQVVYQIPGNEGGYFDVHCSYKNQLKVYSKRCFDPFRRNERITLRHQDECFQTTLAQLCFFKWCLTYKVIEYVQQHLVQIGEDMKKNCGKDELNMEGSISSDMSHKKRKSSRRKSELQVCATRIVSPGTDRVIVTFD